MAHTRPAELLATWEAGLAQAGPGRAALLHRAARPEAGADELLSMPVGEREADLFALRRALFGERMQVRIDCGRCAAAMEFDLDPAQLVRAPRRPDGPLRVAENGWVVEFRLPTVADLAAAAGSAADAAGAPAARSRAGREGTATAESRGRAPMRLLFERCVVSAARAGEPVPAGRLSDLLPERVRRRLAEAAAEADPAAEVTLHVACPECGETTPAELDIASYLWTELDAWARDVLLDVHLLAAAYGWSEPEILALSPQRRRYYLELCADA